MNANVDRASAQIIPFPSRGRFAANGNEQAKLESTFSSAWTGKAVASGNAWYHEEAIRDAEQGRRH